MLNRSRVLLFLFFLWKEKDLSLLNVRCLGFKQLPFAQFHLREDK